MNILTALAENEGVVKKETDGGRKAIALAWLFHLVGDIRYGFRELPVPLGTDQGQRCLTEATVGAVFHLGHAATPRPSPPV